MINCRLAVCSKSAAIDENTNNLSVFEILGDITVESFPIAIHEMTCVFWLTRSEEDPAYLEGDLVTTVNNEEIGRERVSVDFQETLSHRLRINFRGFPLSDPGTVRIGLTLDDIGEVGFYAFQIRQSRTAPEAKQVGSKSE